MSGPAGIDDSGHARLRAAFASIAEVAGGGGECARPEELWESAGGHLGRRQQRAVILHLGDCTACAAAWRLAADLHGDDAQAAVREGSAHGFRTLWMPLAAAAALIVVAVGLSVLFRGPTTRGPAPVFRAQENDWVLPLAETEEPLARDRCVLRWTAGPAGTLYDVRVTTEDLEPIARGRGVDRAEYVVPFASLERVPAGGRILWQVTAHLPDDSRVDSRTFTSEMR